MNAKRVRCADRTDKRYRVASALVHGCGHHAAGDRCERRVNNVEQMVDDRYLVAEEIQYGKHARDGQGVV